MQFTQKARYAAPLLCRFADLHHRAVPVAFGKSRYGKTHSRPENRGKSMGKHSLFAAALLSAALSTVCLPAQADQGDILARVRAISIQPSVSAGGTLGSIGTGVNNTQQFSFQILGSRNGRRHD
jgi:hypothetical protein